MRAKRAGRRWTVGGLGLAAVAALVAFGALPAGAAYSPGPVQTVGGTTNLAGLACASATSCLAVGTEGAGGVVVPVTNGTPGTAVAVPSVGQLNGVACSSATTCFAVGYARSGGKDVGAVVTITNGVPGSAQLIGGAGTLYGIACSGLSCTAVGQNSGENEGVQVAVSTNGNQLGLVPGTVGLLGVGCGIISGCLGVGVEASGTTIEGVGVSLATDNVQAVPAAEYLSTVSCPSNGMCEAGGFTASLVGLTVPFTVSAAPGYPALPGNAVTVRGSGAVLGLSCAPVSTLACTAVGETATSSSGVVAPVGGSGAQPVPGTTGLDAVLCASATSCLAVGGHAGSGVVVALTQVHGYWLVGADGGIFSFGSTVFHGSTGNLVLNRPVVGITPTADLGGYWLVASDGGIFAFGDTQFFGSIPGLGIAPAGTSGPNHLNAPIAGMVPSYDQGGYFMVGADGGVFAFGDATYEGSCPAIGGCSGTAVAVMPDATGKGYWLVTATGNVYTFGDAPYFGAPGGLTSPVTSAVATPDGGGYWVLTASGEVWAFGDATLLGFPTGVGGYNPATAIFSTADGNGYWVATANGTVFNYGDAPADGDLVGTSLNAPIIAGTGF